MKKLLFLLILIGFKINAQERFKLDGVAAVVGDFIILESDIDKQYSQLQVSGISTDDITKCQVFGKLLEDKLYQHHAIQDSIDINIAEIQSYVDQQINVLAEQIGSMEKLISYYKKNSEQELREEFSRKSEEWHAKIKFYQKMFEDSQKNVELEKSRADKLETQLKQIQKFVNDVVSV